MTEYNPRRIKITPAIPVRILEDTFEGQLLWALLNLRIDSAATDELIALESNHVYGVGTHAYSLGGGKLQFWVDRAQQANTELARDMLQICLKGEEVHRGVIDFNLWKGEGGAPLITIEKTLQAILLSHGTVLENQHFSVKWTPYEEEDDISAGAAFVTAEKIETVELADWLADRVASSRLA